jgi:hypothetical protein
VPLAPAAVVPVVMAVMMVMRREADRLGHRHDHATGQTDGGEQEQG